METAKKEIILCLDHVFFSDKYGIFLFPNR